MELLGKSRSFFGVFVLVFCACSSLYGQLEIKAGVRTRVDAAGFTSIGDRIYLDAGATVGGTPVGLLRVISDAPNIEIEVSDVNRIPIEPTPIGEGYYEIDQSGKWYISVRATDFDKKYTLRKTIELILGADPGPGPQPPSPPGPTPGPTPDSLPIDGQGLRILIVSESSEPDKLSSGQRQILGSTQVREYLDSVCAKDPGGHAEYRFFDPQTTFQSDSDKWAKALARPRASLPWIVIANGVKGYEGPLPATVEEMMLLVDSFVGSKVKSVETSVTMLTIEGCGWCKVFKDKEASKLVVDFHEVIGGAKLYPTFILRHAGKEVPLVGFHTADQIHNELKRMGAAK